MRHGDMEVVVVMIEVLAVVSCQRNPLPPSTLLFILGLTDISLEPFCGFHSGVLH